MMNDTAVGVKNYEQFDPGFNKAGTLVPESFDKTKLAYLERNILPLLSGFRNEAAILEIGPGQGALLHLLQQKNFQNIKGFEVCEAYAILLKKLGFTVDHSDDTALYLEKNAGQFEVIVLIDVLEHLERDAAYKLIKSCQQALKPNGRLILQLPNVSGLFGGNTFFADFTHRTGYNEHSLQALLGAAGFHARAVTMLPLLLPHGFANAIRSVLRTIIFAVARLFTRIVGATPIRILTHNIIVTGDKN